MEANKFEPYVLLKLYNLVDLGSKNVSFDLAMEASHFFELPDIENILQIALDGIRSGKANMHRGSDCPGQPVCVRGDGHSGME